MSDDAQKPEKPKPRPLPPRGQRPGPYLGMREHPEVAQAIGLITGYWSHLEYLLCYAFKTLLGVDMKLAETVFYISTNHKVRRDTIEALANQVIPNTPAHERLKDILSDVARLANRRNDLQHDFWKATPRGPITRQSFKPSSKERQPVRETPKQMLSLANEIMKLNGDLLDFLPYLAEQVVASRETLP